MTLLFTAFLAKLFENKSVILLVSLVMLHRMMYLIALDPIRTLSFYGVFHMEQKFQVGIKFHSLIESY